MMYDDTYIGKRRIALVLAIIVLLAAGAVYFVTGAADRGNEMMYKSIYGENASIGDNSTINSALSQGVLA